MSIQVKPAATTAHHYLRARGAVSNRLLALMLGLCMLLMSPLHAHAYGEAYLTVADEEWGCPSTLSGSLSGDLPGWDESLGSFSLTSLRSSSSMSGDTYWGAYTGLDGFTYIVTYTVSTLDCVGMRLGFGPYEYPVAINRVEE